MQEMVRPGINPAYTGKSDVSDLLILSRQQWVGFDGAPKSYFVATNVPLRDQKTGIGIDIQHQNSGPFTQNAVFLSYSYTIGISEESGLSFGLRGGINAYQILVSNLLTIDPGDPLLESDLTNGFLPNFGTGFHYTFRNYYFDFSIPLLLRNEYNPDGTEKMGLQNREGRVYNFQAGADYDVTNGFSIQPAVALWMEKGAPPLIDLRVKASYRNALNVGLVYRINGLVGAYFSYKVSESFLLAYAYELPLAFDYHLTSGTHEVALGFDFQFLKRKTQSPRRF